ncbi:wax ester/triacylglycerol synthase domain-containing protein [Nocardioides ultimimeridianus]
MSKKESPLTWGGGQQMSEFEATMWRANKHPENSTQGGVLEVLAGTPDWDELVAWHEFGLSEFPRFRQKVVEPALPLGPPVWVDADFDLSRHLERVDLGGSATHEELLACAAKLALVALDPALPPWRGHLIEGLDGGRSAYFLIVHHCLMDGHGSVQLFSDLHSRTADRVAAVRKAAAGRTPTPVDVAVGQAAQRVLGLPRLAKGALGVAAGVARDPVGSARFVGSMGRVLAPPTPGKSELLRAGQRTNWAYGTLTCDLAELKAAGKAVDGTINDAYVAAILGGLRRYHELAGKPMGDVVINMPVSMRNDGDSKGGNRFAPAFISAPGSIADPAERMRELKKVVRRASSEPALDVFSLVLPVLNRAPSQILTPLFTSMQNRTDVTLSNVPGAREESRLLGIVIDEIFYFGPLPGSPVMVVLHSHVGKACIGVNCDGDVFDAPVLMACLQEGLDEVLALGR